MVPSRSPHVWLPIPNPASGSQLGSVGTASSSGSLNGHPPDVPLLTLPEASVVEEGPYGHWGKGENTSQLQTVTTLSSSSLEIHWPQKSHFSLCPSSFWEPGLGCLQG